MLRTSPEAGDEENQERIDFQPPEHHEKDEQEFARGLEVRIVLDGADGAQARTDPVQRRATPLAQSISFSWRACPSALHAASGSRISSSSQLETKMIKIRPK